MSPRPVVFGLSFLFLIGPLRILYAAEATSCVSDQAITREVRVALSSHADIGTLLTVRTRKGVVYLGGSISTRFALANAECLARHAPGVMEVISTAGVDEG